jgi:glycine oxidase
LRLQVFCHQSIESILISLFREEYTHLKAKIPLLEEVLIVEKTADIVIIGGGIIGVSIAYNLCKRGVDVTVLEQGTIGSQASGAAAGLLAPLGPLSGPGLYADLLLSSFAMFPSLVKAFSKAATRSGARIYSHVEIAGIQHHHNTITGVHTSQGETIACNHLILTTGVWSAHHGLWFNIELPVSPLKGQLLALHGPQPPLKHIIFGDSAYLAPRGDSTLIGTTREAVGFDTRVTLEGVEALRNTALRFVPALQQCDRETAWAGLRPSTPDRQPILGAAPPWENVTLAVGHNSVGIILSPITGQAIAEVVTTGHVPEIIRPFSLARFQQDIRENAK